MFVSPSPYFLTINSMRANLYLHPQHQAMPDTEQVLKMYLKNE